MLENLLKLLSGKSKTAEDTSERVFQNAPPARIDAQGVEPLDFAVVLSLVNDLPAPDWKAVGTWVSSIQEPKAQAEAWANAEIAWLAHLQQALGPHHHLAQHEFAILLSPLEPKVATATAQFMTKTLARIEKFLNGIAESPEWGKDILLVFEDEDSYYRYVSRYYPEDGEFAFSGGMHINFGCSHFATYRAELRAIEPVIAHEMTHACLGHLSIPAWVNEGLAVNTERRLCPPLGESYTAQQLRWMHRQFWTEETIQEFWSGKSFLRPDEGNLLSYDLARILIEQFAHDWESFKAFALSARLEDAGRAAAKAALDVELGTTVSTLFELEASSMWEPIPSRWETKPERGAFYRAQASRSARDGDAGKTG
jgi:hypothetical protein